MASTRRMSTNVLKLLKTNELHDNVDQNLISIPLNSHFATIQYKRMGDLYDLIHTDIPDQYQGQGLGHILAERVFDHLISKKKKLKLTCEFLQHFYEKNIDKYQDFVELE